MPAMSPTRSCALCTRQATQQSWIKSLLNRTGILDNSLMMTSRMVDVEAWRGERMYWDLASDEDRQLHLSRYGFACDLFRAAWRCLDAACGSGYGAAFLADTVRQVDGVDVDPGAIDYAKATY